MSSLKFHKLLNCWSFPSSHFNNPFLWLNNSTVGGLNIKGNTLWLPSFYNDWLTISTPWMPNWPLLKLWWINLLTKIWLPQMTVSKALSPLRYVLIPYLYTLNVFEISILLFFLLFLRAKSVLWILKILPTKLPRKRKWLSSLSYNHHLFSYVTFIFLYLKTIFSKFLSGCHPQLMIRPKKFLPHLRIKTTPMMAPFFLPMIRKLLPSLKTSR